MTDLKTKKEKIMEIDDLQDEIQYIFNGYYLNVRHLIMDKDNRSKYQLNYEKLKQLIETINELLVQSYHYIDNEDIKRISAELLESFFFYVIHTCPNADLCLISLIKLAKCIGYESDNTYTLLLDDFSEYMKQKDWAIKCQALYDGAMKNIFDIESYVSSLELAIGEYLKNNHLTIFENDKYINHKVYLQDCVSRLKEMQYEKL